MLAFELCYTMVVAPIDAEDWKDWVFAMKEAKATYKKKGGAVKTKKKTTKGKRKRDEQEEKVGGALKKKSRKTKTIRI